MFRFGSQCLVIAIHPIVTIILLLLISLWQKRAGLDDGDDVSHREKSMDIHEYPELVDVHGIYWDPWTQRKPPISC